MLKKGCIFCFRRVSPSTGAFGPQKLSLLCWKKRFCFSGRFRLHVEPLVLRYVEHDILFLCIYLNDMISHKIHIKRSGVFFFWRVSPSFRAFGPLLELLLPFWSLWSCWTPGGHVEVPTFHSISQILVPKIILLMQFPDDSAWFSVEEAKRHGMSINIHYIFIKKKNGPGPARP